LAAFGCAKSTKVRVGTRSHNYSIIAITKKTESVGSAPAPLNISTPAGVPALLIPSMASRLSHRVCIRHWLGSVASRNKLLLIKPGGRLPLAVAYAACRSFARSKATRASSTVSTTVGSGMSDQPNEDEVHEGAVRASLAAESVPL